jgi:hypothetical protein
MQYLTTHSVRNEEGSQMDKGDTGDAVHTVHTGDAGCVSGVANKKPSLVGTE